MEGWENSKQVTNKRKEQVFGMVERVYSWIRHLGRKGKFGKCKRSSQRIWEEILARYGKH